MKTEKCNIANFYKLKIGNTIKLIESDETFYIDKIFEDGHVDMTSTKQYNPEMVFDWYEKFYSIKLVNFEIIS
jgi:hypothetical protein